MIKSWIFQDYSEYGWEFKCPECGEVVYPTLRSDTPKYCPKCYERLETYKSEVD